MDHSALRLGLVETNDDAESVIVEVASILALVIAKGWKIGERFEQGHDAFQEVRKDIADLYRLLRAGSVERMTSTLQTLPRDERLRDIVRTGAAYVGNLCGRRGPGLALLSEILGRGQEAELTLASLEALAEEFAELVGVTLQP